jgi:hypothetical protein
MSQSRELKVRCRVSRGVVVHDVGTVAILAPAGMVAGGAAVTPRALIRNYGSATESFDVMFDISDGYSRTQTVDNLFPGEERTVSFDTWTAPTTRATYATKCTTRLATDGCQGNDRRGGSVSVGTDWPYGWHEVASMPVLPSGKTERQGGWLAFVPGSQLIYAAKGNKTGDFYDYDPVADAWAKFNSIPAGAEGRPPSRGAVGVADGIGCIYATKGNNTAGFWRYTIATDSWQQLRNVPLAPSNKKVRGGTDMEYAEVNDTGYVYLLKGYKDDFYRFNTVSGSWEERSSPAANSGHRWKNGSWLVHDGASAMYAHKGSYHEFVRYDVRADSWSTRLLAGMPMQSRVTGKRKKSKDGGCAAWYDGAIYALKGGNTQEFWRYVPAGDSWTELDTMPAFGSTGRKKKVSYGGDMVGFGGGAFFALKGNKTLECWRYVLPPAAAFGARAAPDGVTAQGLPIDDCRLTVAPNPLKAGYVTLCFNPAKSGPASVRVYDVAGRCVHSSFGIRHSPFRFDFGSMPAGVYLVELNADGGPVTEKLVVPAR